MDKSLHREMYRVLSVFCEYLVGACWPDGERPQSPLYRYYAQAASPDPQPDRPDRYSYRSALVVRALLARYELSETGDYPKPFDSETGLIDVAKAFCDGVIAAQNPDGTVHLRWQDPALGQKRHNYDFDTAGGAVIFHILVRTLPHVDPERRKNYVAAVRRWLDWAADWEGNEGVMLIGPHAAEEGDTDYSRNPYLCSSGCMLALLSDWYTVTGDQTHLPLGGRLLAYLAEDFYRDDGSCGGPYVHDGVLGDEQITMKVPDHFGDLFYIDDGVVRAAQSFPQEIIPAKLADRMRRHVAWVNAGRDGAHWPLAGPTFEGRQHGYWINSKTVAMGGLLAMMDRVFDAGVLTENDREAIARFLVDPRTVELAGLMQETNRNDNSYEATGAAAGSLATLLGADLYAPMKRCCDA